MGLNSVNHSTTRSTPLFATPDYITSYVPLHYLL